MGDIKSFAYGVLGWTEKRLKNASIDYFVHTCLGWNHNDLYETQRINNLNKRLAFAFAHVMTAQKRIDLEPIFKLFDFKDENLINELEEVSTKLPSNLNGKEKRK